MMEGVRFQAEALLALQEAAEAYLVSLFEDGYFLCVFSSLLMCLLVTPARFMQSV